MTQQPDPENRDLVQKPLFTFRQAAAVLSLHPGTVRRMASRGELEVVRFGRAVRIPYDALVRLVEEHRDHRSGPGDKSR